MRVGFRLIAGDFPSARHAPRGSRPRYAPAMSECSRRAASWRPGSRQRYLLHMADR